MTIVGETSAYKDNLAEMVINPLFADEEDVVLIPAGFILGKKKIVYLTYTLYIQYISQVYLIIYPSHILLFST